MGNSFGKLFRITTWGESHGPSMGVTIDGCPPLLPLSESDIQPDLDRRRPGQSNITSPRKESDLVQILSGIYQGQTLGTPISLLIKNEDQKPEEYDHLKDKYRPSHADFTYQSKYGIRNPQGSGRASARETVSRIAAGAIAKKILSQINNIEIRAYVESIHTIKMPFLDHFPPLQEVENS
ncbi:MAG: chorismate synthase, partial [Verrucomicrobia bacterium]